ncbi:MAG: hypothetical protein AAF938_13440 [Myxococcota bacterium]
MGEKSSETIQPAGGGSEHRADLHLPLVNPKFGLRIHKAVIEDRNTSAFLPSLALSTLFASAALAETPANPAFRTAEDQPDFPASGPVRWVSSELQTTYRDGAQSRVELDAVTKAANVLADVTKTSVVPPAHRGQPACLSDAQPSPRAEGRVRASSCRSLRSAGTPQKPSTYARIVTPVA